MENNYNKIILKSPALGKQQLKKKKLWLLKVGERLRLSKGDWCTMMCVAVNLPKGFTVPGLTGWLAVVGRVAGSLLMSLSLCFVQGKLVGICGSVGSGKTSLISAILGQVRVLFPWYFLLLSRALLGRHLRKKKLNC